MWPLLLVSQLLPCLLLYTVHRLSPMRWLCAEPLAPGTPLQPRKPTAAPTHTTQFPCFALRLLDRETLALRSERSLRGNARSRQPYARINGWLSGSRKKGLYTSELYHAGTITIPVDQGTNGTNLAESRRRKHSRTKTKHGGITERCARRDEAVLWRQEGGATSSSFPRRRDRDCEQTSRRARRQDQGARQAAD